MVQPEQLPDASCVRLPTLRRIEGMSEQTGFVPALSHMMAKSNFTIRVKGDAQPLADHQGGLLFVGDHQYRWEFMPLTRLMHTLGRDALMHFTMFYIQRAVAANIGPVVASNLLPLYPGYVAKDNPILGRKPLQRLTFLRHLRSRVDSQELNAQVMRKAGEHLADGSSLNIHPCGNVGNSWSYPWRPGVGMLLANLPEGARPKTLVVPYATSKIGHVGVVAALAARGVLPGPDITLRLGTAFSADNLIRASGTTNPATLTEHIRQRFLADESLR